MPYIGRSTESISNVEVLDNLTFDGSASYTLQKSSVNYVPASANNLLISISGVVQQGNFSVSGSTITFDTTVASSDTCDWILHYGTGLITVPADGSVTDAKLSSTSITGQTAETSANDSDSLLIYDDSATALRKMTRSNFLSGVGGSNTPAFEVYLSANQNVSDNTLTKAQIDTEVLDTDNCFDNSTNYRFTPTTAGKYYIYGSVSASTDAGENNFVDVHIYKNGSSYRLASHDPRFSKGQTFEPFTSAIIDMNGSSDYVELYAKVFKGGGSTTRFNGSSAKRTYFGGYKIII
jgi:hypothetical protein